MKYALIYVDLDKNVEISTIKAKNEKTARV